MASPAITFSILKTHASNKQLEKDSSGYYKVTLGAINSFNSAGQFYIADGVKELVEDSSSLLAKRLKSGYLNGEMEHPEYKQGMTKEAYLLRTLKIDMTNISHHIKEIMFIPTETNSGLASHPKTIRVMGWVKPSGPKGHLLQQAIDNPDQNVAFSIRCLTKDEYIGGVYIKKILQIITWDWVLAPGISIANSWDTLSTESMDLCSFKLEELLDKNGDLKSKLGIGFEDDDTRAMIQGVIDQVKADSKSSILSRW